MEEYNDLHSPYITPFLDPETKNGQEFLKALNEHQNHQAPLPPKKAFLEGKTTPYSMKDRKYYGRR